MERQRFMQRAGRALIAPLKRVVPKVVDTMLEGAARVLVRGHPTNASGNNMSQR
jgi:hypothetical protein